VIRNPLAAALAMGLAGSAAATTVEDELADIKARLAALEQLVADQRRTIQEKDRPIEALHAPPPVSGPAADSNWTDRVEVRGGVEIEAGYHSPYTGDDSSDLAVATAEIGIAAQVSDWVAGEITLLYEEDDTPLEVDVATVTIASPEGGWFLTGGQQYVPFGTYETHLVTDPLSLELGETRETAALFGLESDGFLGAVYLFNGESDKNDDIDRFGLTAGYAHEGDAGGFAMRIGYINHIGDSDALQEAIGGDVNDYVGGVAVDGRISSGPFTVIAEYVTATDSFDVTELGFDGIGAQPKAWNIEAGYAFELADKPMSLAIGYQGSDEALALELPETRIAAALSVEILSNTTLSFEWAHDQDYGTSDGGTGKSADTATAQLALEF